MPGSQWWIACIRWVQCCCGAPACHVLHGLWLAPQELLAVLLLMTCDIRSQGEARAARQEQPDLDSLMQAWSPAEEQQLKSSPLPDPNQVCGVGSWGGRPADSGGLSPVLSMHRAAVH